MPRRHHIPDSVEVELAAQHLRYYRMKAGLNQAELARKIGVNQRTVSHYEKTGAKCRDATKAKIAAALLAIFKGDLPHPPAPPKSRPAEPKSQGHAPGLRPADTAKMICPHCGTANYYCGGCGARGVEFKCVGCSRTFVLVEARGAANG